MPRLLHAWGLAEGLTAAAWLTVVEARRDEAQRSSSWLARQRDAIDRCLAAAEALTSCEKLGHKVSMTVLDRNGLTRAVLKHERATPHTLDSSRGKAYTIVTLGPIFKKDLQSELVAQLAANPAAAALR